MLQNIREYTQGWIASIVGILLCLAFALWGVEYYLNFTEKDGYVAKVNGKKITTSQLNTDYRRISNQVAEQFGAQSYSNTALQKQLKNQALENLITHEVLLQAATKAGYVVSPYLVISLIKQMPEFKENSHFSTERFQRIIARLGYSKEEFINEMRQTYLLNQVASGIMGTAFALPNEIKDAIALGEQSRDFIYYRIPSAKFISTMTINDQQINQYYEQHKNDFIKPEKVQIDYIELSVDDMKKNIAVSDQEIRNYYQDNYSSNDAKKIPALDKIKEKIIQAVQQQKVEQNFYVLNDKLSDLTFTNPNSLDPAANALGLKIKSSDFFTKEGGTNSLTKNPKIVQAAFNSEVLSQGINSSVIEISPGHMVALRVKNHQVEGILPLADVRNKIVERLKIQSASDKAKNAGEELLKYLTQSDKITDAFKQRKLSYSSKLHATRSDKDIDPLIIQAVFSLPSPTASKKSLAGVSLSNGDYAILVLNTIHQKPFHEVSKQQLESYEKRLMENNGKLEYDLYVDDQMQHAKIKVNKNAVTNANSEE